MVKLIRIIYFLVPIAIVLAYNAITIISNPVANITKWLSTPGFAIWIIINPTWEGMHNYNNWTIFTLNLIFYFAFIYFIITIYTLLMNRKTKK